MAITLTDIYQFTQAVSWAATAAAACFGVYKYFPEARERRKWEKAKLAKEMIDDLGGNAKALDASYMLGAFLDRRYERSESGTVKAFRVTPAEVRLALDPSRAAGNDDERYIRECFDEFLFHLDYCAIMAETGVVDWADLQPMFLNLFAGVERAMEPVLENYARYLRYFRAAKRIPGLVEAALTCPR